MQAQAPEGEEQAQAQEGCSLAESLRPGLHFVTGNQIVGKPSVHVAHAWDSRFADLVACIAEDADGRMDRCYAVDVFTTSLHEGSKDPVGDVRRGVSVAEELLLVLDAEALALRRLWVLFELLAAAEAGKRLRVRCQAPGGFGATTGALTAWEAHVDGIDWTLAEASRKSDEKRIRGFADRAWEQGGKGIERMLAQVRTQLRREIYGGILLAAVEAGDCKAVAMALKMGANPEQQDTMGNTVEELASFDGRTDIEEMIFAKRMQGRSHMPLSSFFGVQELRRSQQNADPSVLQPFLTCDEASTAASSARRTSGTGASGSGPPTPAPEGAEELEERESDDGGGGSEEVDIYELHTGLQL